VANNNSANGSSGSNSAAQFLSFDIDKTWALPGCYRLVPGQNSTRCKPIPANPNPDLPKNPKQRSEQKSRWVPGVNTYFDVRLTAIPVAATPPAQPPSGSMSPATTQTGDLTSAFLTSQKTGRLGVGIYFPFLVSRWTYNGEPNALFIAPIGKVGFNALTGPTQQTFVVSGSASSTGTPQTVTQNFNQLYNFYGFGARIGHYTMAYISDKAPELNSYLDITFGPYSNLPSYVCVAQPKARAPLPLLVGSGCNQTYPLTDPNLQYGDSQTRLWRLDLEGILKVPHTPIIVGFNANIGQRVTAPALLDRGLQPNDDLRFLFGFRSDIATIMQKLGVTGPQK